MSQAANSDAARIALQRSRPFRRWTLLISFFGTMVVVLALAIFVMEKAEVQPFTLCHAQIIVGVGLFAIGWWHVLLEVERKYEEHVEQRITRGLSI